MTVQGLNCLPNEGRMIPLMIRIAAAALSGWLAAAVGGCVTDGSTVVESQRVPPAGVDEHVRQRETMVREQLRARDIKDERVLAAMLKVPRHLFVAPDYIPYAYDDNALALALGQTISQPYIVAFMTQALGLRGKERVLEIGTGSGYQAAVLAELAPEIYTVEILPDLSKRASGILEAQGYRNIHFKIGDGYQGWPEFAPYDCIMVTAAPDHVPQPLVDQLKPGGRMIIPVGRFEQDLVLIEKGDHGITRHSTIPVRFVPMTGRAAQPRNER
jgi:protein-L-isoaspartate(D-aspartate) O-methyltransferase